MFKLHSSGRTCRVTQEETVLKEQRVSKCGKKTLLYVPRSSAEAVRSPLTLEKIDKRILYLRLAH